MKVADDSRSLLKEDDFGSRPQRRPTDLQLPEYSKPKLSSTLVTTVRKLRSNTGLAFVVAFPNLVHVFVNNGTDRAPIRLVHSLHGAFMDVEGEPDGVAALRLKRVTPITVFGS
jgi:hypothetical protein